MSQRYLGLLLVLGLIVAGCTRTASEAPHDAAARSQSTLEVAALGVPADRAPAAEGVVGAARYVDAKEHNTTRPDTIPPGGDRKIIYQASIDLVVEDFSPLTDRVTALVKQFDGYVADSNLAGASGVNRRATWKIRVPVQRFDAFVAAAKELGELTSAHTSSQDVSEEFYDVEARIRNKTKEEERLLKLLEERPGELKDVIAIERELSRVREELERMQGRMRLLAGLTSLTTVELKIAEIRGYQPPEAPTLATRLRRSFVGSLSDLGSAGEESLVWLAGLLPWLPVLAMIAAGGYFAFRRVTWRGRAAR